MDLYTHVRIIVGVVISLGLTHLLRSFANIIQHPHKEKLYGVHMTWAVFMLIYILHYWWWEFHLRELREWSFAVYLFIIAYAVLIYMTCSMLFPDSMDGYGGYEDYYYARKSWFFGMMIVLFALDFVDTLLKGHEYYLHLGVPYTVRAVFYIVGYGIAIKTPNRRYHQLFSIAAIAYQFLYIFSLYAGKPEFG
jgi:hypothetical protein